MRSPQPRKRLIQTAATLGLLGMAIFTTAAPAFADTSQASALALSASIGPAPNSTTLVTTGPISASNDGTPPPTTVTTPGINVLNQQAQLQVSGLSQAAVASPDGTSSACAGVVGPAGIVQIGAQQQCTGSANATHGVNIGNGQILADAVYSSCSASSNGAPPTGSSSILNLNLGGSGQPGSISAPANFAFPPAPANPLFNLLLNQQTISGGKITVTALEVTSPATGLDIVIGRVTCGPNAATAATPAIPMKGLPIAGGVVAIAAGGFWMRRRHLISRAS